MSECKPRSLMSRFQPLLLLSKAETVAKQSRPKGEKKRKDEVAMDIWAWILFGIAVLGSLLMIFGDLIFNGKK
jgi:hypothetical protein